MTIEEKVYAILGAAGAVTTLCPATRIKPPGIWQNLARPYIVHFPVSMEPTRTHGGLEGLRMWDSYQVSIFADSYSAGSALAKVVRNALDGTHVTSPATEGVTVHIAPSPWWVSLDEETQVHHFALNFRIAEAS